MKISFSTAMQLDHIGIVNENRGMAVRFYTDLLGMDLSLFSTIDPDLSQKLFGWRGEITMLVFTQGELKIEVFILPGSQPQPPHIAHFCIQVRNISAFLTKMGGTGVKVISARRGEKTVYFIEDFSGNRIEIKQFSENSPQGTQG